MTTTAFYRQLTEEPQPMDALRTQTERAEAAEAELLAVRDDNHSMMLEIHNLRIERDALAAELAKLRGQEPVAWMREDGNLYLAWQKDLCLPEVRFSPLYAAPVPAVAAGLPAIGPYRDFIPAPAVPAPSVPEEWRESTKAMLLSLDEAIRAGNAVYVRQEDKVVNHRHCWMRFHETRQVVEALLQSAPPPPKKR